MENDSKYKVIGFNLDSENNMLLVISKELDCIQEAIWIKIIDLSKKHSVILNCEVLNKNMKGILISGQYQLTNGHIYYNNNVIKLRYDLMTTLSGEEALFNQYLDILNLNIDAGETVKTNSPLDSP